MTSLRIEKLRPESEEVYDRYILGRPETLFYYCSKYKAFLKSLLGCEEEYLLALEGHNICGALPLMFSEWRGRRVYNSLPFYGSNGGIVAEHGRAHTALTDAYREIACRDTILSSTVIENPFAAQNANGLPSNLTDHRIAQFTGIEFEADHRENILARIDSSARRNIMKATREGVTVEVDHSQLPRLREMHQVNIRALGGLPKSDKFFALIPKHFAPDQDFKLYVAKKDGVVIAGLLIFYFNQTVEYYTPAVDAEYRTIQPLALILIEAMADASRLGFVWWNWGGTWKSQDGVYRFKKKWGAVEGRYNYYTQLNDASLLEWPQDRILKAFPNFYVAPFSSLKQSKEINVA